jgi:hypothetical protein
MSHEDLAKLAGELLQVAYDYELQAARAREFIPDEQPIPVALTHALRAAVASGAALGFRAAADQIFDTLTG